MLGKMFAGRNGIDRYTISLAIFALIFFPYPYIWVISVMLIGYAVFRAFSRNLDNRRKELYKFDEISRLIVMQIKKSFLYFRDVFGEFKNKLQKIKTRISQKKQYLFLKCPKCKKTLRLPRHKGKLQATCPVCGTEFIKKT